MRWFRRKRITTANVLKHEYGHILQEHEMGFVRYVCFVAVPSVAYNFISRNHDILHENYYNMPWEYDVDIRGGANRDYSSWAEPLSQLYFGALLDMR